ncbi:hypothetical protein LINPERHAP1_LOCUS39564, partial [Linum perenne]
FLRAELLCYLSFSSISYHPLCCCHTALCFFFPTIIIIPLSQPPELSISSLCFSFLLIRES